MSLPAQIFSFSTAPDCTIPEAVRSTEDRQAWRKLPILSLGSMARVGYEYKQDKKKGTRTMYAKL